MGFLEPEILHPVDAARLAFIQELFHGLVRATMLGYNIVEPLRLPQLSVLTEFGDDSLWFPIPGMFGGFNLWFEGNGRDAVLWAESWSRMVNGSGMRHRITPVEIILVEEGFA